MPQESEDGELNLGLEGSFVLSSLSLVWGGRSILNGLGQLVRQAKELILHCFLSLFSLELSLPYFFPPFWPLEFNACLFPSTCS